MLNLNKEEEYREHRFCTQKRNGGIRAFEQPPTARRLLRFEEKIPERPLDQRYRENINSSGILRMNIEN